jgi:CRP/FNR family cyclic AMP-dependent transcriptional regulator
MADQLRGIQRDGGAISGKRDCGRKGRGRGLDSQLSAVPSWPLRQPTILAPLMALAPERLAAMTHRRVYKTGESLFRQGDLQERVFIIRRGTARAFYSAASGREITLAYWQGGDLLGALGVFGRGVYGWSCEAITSIEAFVIRDTDMRTLVATVPELAVGVVEALSFKVQWLSRLIQMFGTQSVGERVARLLDMLCELYGLPQEGGFVIDAPLTHEDLAAMVGASRQWVTTALAGLQSRGIVKVGMVGKRRLVVLRRDLLSSVQL